MSIYVACACGQAFNARENLAGRTLPCPACGCALRVPAPGLAQAASTMASLRSKPAPVPCSLPPVVLEPGSLGTSENSNVVLYASTAVGIALALLVLCIVVHYGVTSQWREQPGVAVTSDLTPQAGASSEPTVPASNVAATSVSTARVISTANAPLTGATTLPTPESLEVEPSGDWGRAADEIWAPYRTQDGRFSLHVPRKAQVIVTQFGEQCAYLQPGAFLHFEVFRQSPTPEMRQQVHEKIAGSDWPAGATKTSSTLAGFLTYDIEAQQADGFHRRRIVVLGPDSWIEMRGEALDAGYVHRFFDTFKIHKLTPPTVASADQGPSSGSMAPPGPDAVAAVEPAEAAWTRLELAGGRVSLELPPEMALERDTTQDGFHVQQYAFSPGGGGSGPNGEELKLFVVECDSPQPDHLRTLQTDAIRRLREPTAVVAASKTAGQPTVEVTLRRGSTHSHGKVVIVEDRILLDLTAVYNNRRISDSDANRFLESIKISD